MSEQLKSVDNETSHNVDEDLGGKGESDFGGWCSSAGLIANDSKRKDAAGWDYIVQFKLDYEFSNRTLHKSGIECKIQIKSTRKLKKSWQIKLSNLRHACTSSLPHFIASIEYDNEHDAQRVYLIHIDKSIIHKTFEKLQKAKINGDKENNITILINYDESHIIDKPFHQGIKNKILEYIGPSMEQYQTQKMSTTREVGYNEKNSFVEFKTQPEKTQDLIEALLGKEKEVEIFDILHKEIRFDCEEIISNEKIAKIKILNRQENAKLKISYTEKTSNKKSIMDAKFYIIDLPDEHYSDQYYSRIETDFFDIFIKKMQKDIEITIDKDRNYSIEKLINFYKTLDIIYKPNNEFLFELSFPEKEFSFLMKTSDETIAFETIIDNLTTIKKISNSYDFFQDILLTPNEVLKKKNILDLLGGIYNKSDISIKLSIVGPLDSIESFKSSKDENFIFTKDLTINLGATSIYLVFSSSTTRDLIKINENNTATAYSKEIKIEHFELLESKKITQNRKLEEVSERIKESKPQSVIWILFD